MCTYMHVYVCMCTHTYMCVCVYVRVCMYMCMYIRTHMHVCMCKVHVYVCNHVINVDYDRVVALCHHV